MRKRMMALAAAATVAAGSLVALSIVYRPASARADTAAASAPASELPTQHATAPSATAPAAEEIDADEVRAKIAAIAVPDETIAEAKRPVSWLMRRRDRIIPQLIAALNDPDAQIAQTCLHMLRGAPASDGLVDALVAKAGDANSPLRYQALLQLERWASQPRVASILDRASSEEPNSPDDVLVKAKLASWSGNTAKAVYILKPLFDKPERPGYRHQPVEAIRMLSEMREPASVTLLEKAAAGDDWDLAGPAYLALAKVDPNNRGLTKDQTEFLEASGRGGKETLEHWQARMDNLSRAAVKEVRPYVMQMLRDDEWPAVNGALRILTAWNDKEALPEIRQLIGRRFSIQVEAVAAYLAIEGGQQSQDDVLALLKANKDFDNESVVRGIVLAETPVDRKAAILREAQARLKSPYVVPNAVRFWMYRNQGAHELRLLLMDNETDVRALGIYCEMAVADKEERFAAQVRRAMGILSREPAVSAGGEKIDGGVAEAAQRILDAVAAYGLKDLAGEVKQLAESRNAAIRNAAQAAAARLGVAGAMTELYAQLGAADAGVRAKAAKALLAAKPANETERTAREAAALSHLGTPCEDYAMRVLATCGGDKAAKALAPILDGNDVQRAVYAAWVMAQLPDSEASAKGLRRVAIYAMFGHQIYQQGEGIDFPIAPELLFHQVTGRLNPDPKAYASGEGPVRIPPEMLRPFGLLGDEEEFIVRCYRFIQARGRAYPTGIDFLSGWWMEVPPMKASTMDRSYLPLLKVIATEDAYLTKLMVKGQAVAHLQYRQAAAKAIAEIAGEKATYIGLAGETLDSAASPQLYPDQDRLIAKHVVDWIATAMPKGTAQTDHQWRQIEACRYMARRAEDEFGPSALAAIRKEANDRGIDTQHILPKETDKSLSE